MRAQAGHNISIQNRLAVIHVPAAGRLLVTMFVLGTLAMVGGVVSLNLFRFFVHREGVPFAGVSVALHTLYFLYSSLALGLVAVAVKIEQRVSGKKKTASSS